MFDPAPPRPRVRPRQRTRLAGVLGVAALGLLLALAGGSAQAVERFEQVKAAWQPSDTLILDRHGELLHRQRVDTRVRRGQWVPLAEMSPALRQALLLSEDRRFYQHAGIDWAAVGAAAWGRLWHSHTRGASTVTMQLAGLLDEDLRQRPGGRSVRQKLGQAIVARELEAAWRKDEILEAYLNLVPLRGELVGIDALARTLFAKAPHGLDARESAITAALVRAPGASAERVAQRACGVWKDMQSSPAPLADAAAKPAAKPAAASAADGAPTGSPAATATATATDCTALSLLTQAALARRAYAPSEGLAPHWARRVLADARAHGQAAPARLRTSLDARLQRVALESLQRHLRELHAQQARDGAVVVLDNASGQVLAWVGSSGELSAAAEVDGVTARRQPGSALKPLLYAQAIAERRLTAASLLDDSPAHLPTAAGLYVPQNYDRRFKGWVSARTALAASLNVPAVRVLAMVSPDAFARQLDALGLALAQGGDHYGLSLALGSAEVTLLDLTNAYRALALGGRSGPVTLRPDAGAAPTRAVLDAGAAFIVGDMLADANARAPTFGTDSLLATRFWSAVKTGTSKDMRDNWALGYTPRYSVGVWVGNASGAPMWDVSGTSGAAPVWADVMAYLHQRTPTGAPTPPAGVQRARVRFGPAPHDARGAPLEAARDEWFLPGTAQTFFAIDPGASESAPTRARGQNDTQNDAQNATQSAPAAARIRTPVDGTILALDPDIPPTRQRLLLRADALTLRAADLRWSVAPLPRPAAAPAPGASAAPAAGPPPPAPSRPQPLARGAQALWQPWPGRYQITLSSASGQVLDRVQIEVRGASLRAGAARQPMPQPRPAPGTATAGGRHR